MELIENIDQIDSPYKDAVVTIGNFDGVHKGHQALLHQVMEMADEIDGTSVAMTFEPHPLRALGISSPPLITRHDQKIELLEQSSIPYLSIETQNNLLISLSHIITSPDCNQDTAVAGTPGHM